MRIYLLRHGNAEDPSRRPTDEDRQLTDEGRDEVARVGRAVRRAKVDMSLVITSPYVRAVQTADIAVEALGYKGQVARTKALEPDSDPDAVWQEIRTHSGLEHLLLVGHEPLLSRTVAYLLGAPSLSVKMTTGSMVCVEADDFGKQPRCRLRWMVTPKVAQ
jgi:phosphohistidine phosphatase